MINFKISGGISDVQKSRETHNSLKKKIRKSETEKKWFKIALIEKNLLHHSRGI